MNDTTAISIERIFDQVGLETIETKLKRAEDNLIPYSNANWELVDSDKECLNAINNLSNERIIGLDIETTGLFPHNNTIRLIQIATPSSDIPVYIFDVRRLDRKPLRDFLNLRKIAKVGHNLNFEIQFLTHHLGINPIKSNWIDTLLMAHLLRPGLPPSLEEDMENGVLPIPELGAKDTKSEKKLKEALNKRLPGPKSLMRVVARHLWYALDKSQQVSDWGKSQLSQQQLQYAANDAKVVLELRDCLREKLIADGLSEAIQIELRALPRVALMSLYGMGINHEKWAKLAEDIKRQKEASEKEACAVFKAENQQLSLFDTDVGINLESKPELIEAMRLRGIKTNSTKKETLEKLAETHPEVLLIMQYRHWSKAHSSFGEKLPTHINPVTGRIHPNVNQTGADSGRFSFSNPNLQQIPRDKKYRGCFVPQEGYVYVIADYSQIELRIAAEIADDERMITAYVNGDDLHRLTASLVGGIALEAVTKEQRQLGKAVNFGLIYGMGAKKLRVYAESNYGVKLSLEEAEGFRGNFFDNYSGLRNWHKSTLDRLRNEDLREIRTLSGRVRYWKESPSLSAVLNTPVQGTSADITKVALKNIGPEFDDLGAFPVVVVHDEIVLEVPEENSEQAASFLETAMICAGQRFIKKVPIEVEATIGTSWADK